MDKKTKILDLKLRLKSKNIFAWITKSNLKWNGLDFNNLREYSQSDDVKKIDWIISARERKPYIREYDEEKDMKFIFLLDVGYDMWFASKWTSKMETLLETFDILSLSALNVGHKVWSVLFDNDVVKFIPPSTSKASLISTKKLLKTTKNESNLDKINAFLRTLRLKNSVIFYLTDNIDNKDISSLKHLSLRNDVFYINIFDSFENNLFWENGMVLSSWNENFFLNLNKSKDNEYSAYRSSKIGDFRRELWKHKIGYISLDEEKNIYKTLLCYFCK